MSNVDGETLSISLAFLRVMVFWRNSAMTSSKLPGRSMAGRPNLTPRAFAAAKAPERDIVLCQLVAQRVGKLTSFTVGGQALDADTLSKCNAKAN